MHVCTCSRPHACVHARVSFRPRHRQAVRTYANVQERMLPQFQLPNGLSIRYTSTPAEVMFLYEEVYSQQQYLQHGVQLKPGDTVLDAGGNIGLFAMLAAEAVGPLGLVVSLEPAPHTAAALAANLEQHRQWRAQLGKEVARSVVLPLAVTDDPAAKTASFTVYNRAAGWSSLSPDDDEVVANMQAYLRSLLQEPSAATQQQQQQAMPSSTSLAVPPDSRGWSPTQRTLVWCARQLTRIPGINGVTDALMSWYVKLAMLSDAEQVTVQTATLSCIIERQDISQCTAMLGVLRRRVDLLKVDVERAELLVLQGIAPHHWPIIEQVTMEVHDIKGRLDQVVSLLKQLGFSRVTVEQPSHLQGTDLYNLYATRAPAEVQV